MLRFKSFLKSLKEFYPEYLKAHDDIINRVFHFIGASLFWLLIGLFFMHFNLWFLPAAVVIGYLLPGIGHHFFQHNKSFRTSKPFLCVVCAFWLYIDTLTFQIGKKMKQIKTSASL